MKRLYHRKIGFTLAELLVALGVLSIITTFTIPKVLYAQTDYKYKAMGKEAAGMISQALMIHKLSGLQAENTRPRDLLTYMNYVSLDTSSSIDDHYTAGSLTCSADNPCIHLHNGGVLAAKGQFCYHFGGTGPVNLIEFVFDPDGQVTDGTTNGPGKAVQFELYYNGGLTTRANSKDGSTCSLGPVGSDPTADPPWFSW